MFLTEQMYWHLIPQDQDIPQCSIFRGKKKKEIKNITPAALEVTHEAAQMKLEIQYLVLPLTGAEQRRISSFFARPAVAKRADPSPLLKSAGTGIFKTGHDLLKGQGQLKTHISGWAYYYQWGLQHDHYQGGPPTPLIPLCCFSPALWLRVHASWAR